MKRLSISEIVSLALSGPCVEPVKRVKDLNHVQRGLRHLPVSPRYIGHRFPIKGGIPRSRLFAENVMASNALFRKLAERHQK